MFFSLLVSLYTSRIVLNELGFDDFGVYGVVGGIVVMFGFLNGAMASATTRYLSFAMGKEDEELLKKTFNSTLLIHIGIILIILIFAETLGLWYINNRLNVHFERRIAVNLVFQFSLFASLVNIVQVPFNAIIIAKEKMNVYALLSIIDVFLKLGVAFLLIFIVFDKLVLYSILVAIVSIITFLSYLFYCKRFFQETRFKFYKDSIFYNELINYSAWNLFGNFASVAKGQGINLVLNVFFGTVINAAYSIAMQVQAAVVMFVSNFQLAVNPQIIKSYSQNNHVQTSRLIVQSSKFSFFFLLIIISPILFNTNYILTLWLKSIPSTTVLFVKLCLITVLIDSLSGSLMTGIQATGKIKTYQAVVGLLLFLNLPISYLVLKITNTPSHVFIIGIITSLISLQLRLYFLFKTLRFDVSFYFKEVIFKILAILGFLFIFYCILIDLINLASSFKMFVTHSVIIIIMISLLIFLIGVNKTERQFLYNLIKK